MSQEQLRMANNVALPQLRGGACFCKGKKYLSCNMGTVTFCKNLDAFRAGRPDEIYLMDLNLLSGRKATEAAGFILSITVDLYLQPSSTNHALAWELIAYTDLLVLVPYLLLFRMILILETLLLYEYKSIE
jgi:hypothetical protein